MISSSIQAALNNPYGISKKGWKIYCLNIVKKLAKGDCLSFENVFGNGQTKL